MEYRIYPFEDPSRLEEICTLFATGLGDTSPDDWKWKHFTDNGQPDSQILVAEAEDGSFAGVFALQPEFYECAGRRLSIIQTEDLVISPDHRGSGLMRKLYFYAMDYYTRQGATALLAFSNENSYPIFLKYGATDMGDSHPLHTSKSWLPLYFNRKNDCWKDWRISVTDQMPADLFFTSNDEAYQMVKNERFMKWKFVDNPESSYRWLTIRKGTQLMGYMPFYVTEGRLLKAVNICDWALKEEVDTPVLKRAVRLLRSWGNFVNVWGRYCESVQQRWAAAGVNRQAAYGTHFLLHKLNDEPLPENFHLTRADLDY